jgi:acyl carrier protein
VIDTDVSGRVKRTIIEVLNLDLEPAQLADDVPLYSTTIRLDSLTLLQLITELEKEFSCQVDDEAVMMADLFDVGSIITLVASQLGS